jgi:hypothetical protein
MNAMLADPVTVALLVAGVVLGHVIFQRRWGRPWSYAYRASGRALAGRITSTARMALDGRTQPGSGALGPADLAALEAFYTRWLNLPREERDALREALRSEGFDMILLGDTLRRHRAES